MAPPDNLPSNDVRISIISLIRREGIIYIELPGLGCLIMRIMNVTPRGDLTSFVSHLQQPVTALFVFHNINALIERNA